MPGLKKVSDTMNKNVLAAVMQVYLDLLNPKDADGRSAVAQRLHAVRLHSPVFASSGVVFLLTGVTGGRALCVRRLGCIGGEQPARSVGEPPGT